MTTDDLAPLSCMLFLCSLAVSFPIGMLLNFWIIPRMQKRLGIKLHFDIDSTSYAFSSPVIKSMLRHAEVVLYIAAHYWARKFGIDPKKLHFSATNALYQINFQLEQATKFEIFLCNVAWINFAILLISAIVTFIALFV